MSAIQSIVFMINKGWTTQQARSWLSEHGIKPLKRVHKLKNELRYRIRDPKKFKRYITKKMNNGILFVIEFSTQSHEFSVQFHQPTAL